MRASLGYCYKLLDSFAAVVRTRNLTLLGVDEGHCLTNFNLRRRKRRRPIGCMSSADRALFFVSAGRCRTRRVGQLASTVSGQIIPVDSQIFISTTRALCFFLRTCSATFGAANVSVRPIANIQPNVVELFPRRIAIAAAFWLIGKTLRST